VITRNLKTPKSARTEFAAAADLAVREGLTDMKQSEVCGVPSENLKTNNVRGKWTGFRIKESIVNTDCFQSVVVMMMMMMCVLLLLRRALRLYRMESHHPPVHAVTAAMDSRRHTVCLWNVFIRMMRVAVNNEIWKNS